MFHIVPSVPNLLAKSSYTHSNSCKNGIYTMILAEAQAAGWHFISLSHETHTECWHLLLHFGLEVMVRDLLHQMSLQPWRHIVDSQPLESTKSRSGSNNVSSQVFKEHPVSHMYLGQATVLNNGMQAITCRSPCAGWIILLIWFGPLLQKELHDHRRCD